MYLTGKNIAKIIGGAIFLVGIVVGFLIEPLTSDTYNGKVSFENESDYSVFKEVLSGKDVSFLTRDILVMSSEPPIVVQFRIKVPEGQENVSR